MNENLHIQREMDDKPGEECGVFGIYDFDGNDVASDHILWSVCITAPRTGELWYRRQ